MDNGREVVVLSGVRTAIGDYGGALKDLPPSDLAATVVKEAVKRAKIDPKQVNQLVLARARCRDAQNARACRSAIDTRRA